MEQQAYHIQVLLVDELDWYKEKEREVVDKHIKILQEAYQDSYWDTLQLMIIDKRKAKERHCPRWSIVIQILQYIDI